MGGDRVSWLSVGRITQRVDPERVAAALVEHGRAAIAFDRDGEVDALPVAVRRRDDELWIGLAPEAVPPATAFAHAALVLDDGSFWFELRAVNWRGRIREAAPPEVSDDLVWLSFVPSRASAWDYATLHEEPAP